MSACRASGYTVFPATAAFSDDILFTAKIAGGRSQNAYDKMCEIISLIDCQVSLTDQYSDISRFNRAEADERVEVGKFAYELFNIACGCYELTDGAYNCAISPLCELWHVDAASLGDYAPDVDGSYTSPDLPTLAQITELTAFCSPENVSAVEDDGRYFLTKSDGRIRLDFGGIAKGYAVDKCVEVLNEYNVSSALLDISGNVYLYGDYIGGADGTWNIGILSPRPRAAQTVVRDYVCALSTEGYTSAVTSGDYMRYYIHDNADGSKVYVPHIIGTDGVPIGVEQMGGEWINSGEWVISATVLGESSAVCDALSTAVSALGPKDGAELLKNVGYKGLIFTEKRYTIVGDIRLYDPDKYDGYKSYEYYEL